MGTKDSNEVQINEYCRNRRLGQLSAGASFARLDAFDSELFTILDRSDLPHQRRVSRPSAGRHPHRHRNGLDGSELTRHGLGFFSPDVDCNIHSSYHGYKTATPLEVALTALVRGKLDTDLRLNCDVGRRKCDEPDHLR